MQQEALVTRSMALLGLVGMVVWHRYLALDQTIPLFFRGYIILLFVVFLI